MDRRTTLIALGSSIPLLMTAGRLRAETASPETATSSAAPITPATATAETLRWGQVARITSNIAQEKSGNTLVKDFARGEVIEQVAIAQALTSMANPPPVELTYKQKQIIYTVENASPSNFDMVYVGVQIQGHHILLSIQENLLASNLPYTDDAVHIALIGQAFIKNHLIALNLLQASLSGGTTP